MSELVMSAEIDRLIQREPPVVYDDGDTKLYGQPDPSDLAESITRACTRAVADPRALAQALNDFANDQHHFAQQGRLTHACFDALIAGDEAMFGNLLARAIRALAINTAAEKARDDYEEAHE